MSDRQRYCCQECGTTSPRWLGRCPGCGQYNTMVEERVSAPAAKSRHARTPSAKAQPVSAIQPERLKRLSSGLEDVDRVLGGGIVPGALILLGGDPGIGKSTLLLQIAGRLARSGDKPVLYITAEESAEQTRIRADRLGLSSPRLFLLAEDNLDDILAELEGGSWSVAIVDSLQTVYDPELESAPGSVSQVRAVTTRLMRLAKSACPVFLVGHVNKEGSMRPVA